MSPELHRLRTSLLFSSFLHAGALMTTVLGLGLLPLADRVEAVTPAAPPLLRQQALAAPPVKLAALASDASGITWNDSRGSLFAVRNSEPLVVEMNSDGDVLRSIRLQDFRDVEGITWLDGDRFAVVEERDCSVWLLDLPPGVAAVARPAQPLFALPALNASRGNKGCEDLAWNPDEQVFYLAREKSPVMLLRVSGVRLDAPGLHKPQVQILPAQHAVDRFGTDISGLHFDQQSGQLLVLSDESRRITGVASGTGLPLLSDGFQLGWWHNGLGRAVPQPEGVTLGRDGTLYVLSEPDLLYRFDR